MKKIYDYICDAAVVIGCCVGVGFLCGKEAQVFFGNAVNVAVFAVVFFAVNVIFREYCRKKRCSSLSQLSVNVFTKFAWIFDLALTTCCFVCIVTMLAGAEQCLGSVLPVSSVIPLYGLVTSVIAAAVLSKGMKALKIANVISITLAVALIVTLLCINTEKSGFLQIKVPPYKPAAYALFSVTMSFGVTTQLGAESDLKRNLITSATAAAVLSALTLLIIYLSDFSLNLPAIENIKNPYVLALSVVTITLSAVTGIVANAMPIVEQMRDFIPDHSLCCILTFGSALAFSLFGFDFAVNFGYVLVGVIGAIVIIAAVARQFCERRRKSA